MADGAVTVVEEARRRAYATPLADFQVADVELFRTDTHWPWFERLRREDPVHWCADSEFGPYWSVTKFNDIIAVDGNHGVFSSSSELGGIAVVDGFEPHSQTSFIGLDPPMHDAQRKVVTPMFSTTSMADMAPLIRERAAKILDELPVGETFDFVDKVSVELTSQMLATLFDFPFEHRRLLPRASDLILTTPGPGALVETEAQRQGEMFATFTQFAALWSERKGAPARNDLISMLATAEATASDDPYRYMGNIVLLVVAGSDTTRHSISGALLAFNQNPDAFVIDRERPRQHVSFGFGVHRCVGNRLAEMQLRVVWEEVLKRWQKIEVMEEPKRVRSSFVKGYEHMAVRIVA